MLNIQEYRQSIEKNEEETEKQNLEKIAEVIELPKQKLEVEYSKEILPDLYKGIIERNNAKINQNAKNMLTNKMYQCYN